MSKETERLKLFKYEPITDGKKTFNIDEALNNNWDKLEAAYIALLAAIAGIDPSEAIAAHNQSSEAHADIRELLRTLASQAASQANLDAHTGNQNNPHNVTAIQVGARPNTWTPDASAVGALPIAGGTLTSAQPVTRCVRNSALNSNEITPTVNGEICWLYE